MTQASEPAQLFTAFKTVLKQRKVTYGDLAERTGTSVSAVKRIFSIEECSLSRLVELLGAVDLSLADLMAFAAESKVEVSHFSVEAEEFLAESIDYFFFYRKLFHHRDVEAVRRRQGLTRQQTIKYLRKLDDLGILKWLPDDRIQFSHSEFLRFREGGPLKRAVYRAWLPRFHQTVLDRMESPDYGLRLFSARCTPELKQSFTAEFADLAESFMKRATLDQKTQPDRLESFAVSLATGPFRVGLDDSDYT